MYFGPLMVEDGISGDYIACIAAGRRHIYKDWKNIYFLGKLTLNIEC